MDTLASSPALPAVLEPARESLAAAPEWLAKLRRDGLAAARSLPMPRLGDEPWRYSDTRSLTLEGFAPAPEPSEAVAAALLARSTLVNDAAGLAVFVDGHCILKPALSPALAAQGVVFETLADAIKHRPALLQAYLLKHKAELGSARFLALHGAWLGAGTVLHVPKGVRVDQPFVAVHWTSTEGAAVFPHSLIVAEESAEVTWPTSSSAPRARPSP